LEQSELEARLGKGLVELLHTETVFSIKRLLPADIKTAYVGRGFGRLPDCENPFSEDFAAMPHEEKGGMRLHENVTYNCLVGDFNASEQSSWQCPICQVEIVSLT
jgi:lipopolysaccharide biosynthesis regulator YciM